MMAALIEGYKPKTVSIPKLVLHMKREKLVKVPRGFLAHSADAACVAEHLIGRSPDEQLIALMLDGRSNLTGYSLIAKGGFHGMAIRPSDVLRHVLTSQASAFILAHNHPSGDSTPSEQDKVFTDHVIEASNTVGVPCVDHVIVTRTGRFDSVTNERNAVFSNPE